MPSLALVVGTRPNFVKAAPFLHAAPDEVRIDLIHTGQHYDFEMSQAFFDDLRIPEPDIHLGVGSGTHAEQTAAVLVGVERILLSAAYDALVVIGDVNSTMGAALAASKVGTPVAHIEAGVRSHDLAIPEEVNRIVSDQVSRWLFVPTEDDVLNLRREGFGDERIHLVGNFTIDAMLMVQEVARRMRPAVLSRAGVTPDRYGVMTLHRPSNVDDRDRLLELLEAIGDAGIDIVFPVHPRTREILGGGTALPATMKCIAPLGYTEFHALLDGAAVVVTDSGGLPAEASVLGIPCVTVFNSTAWPVTVSQGTNRVAGTDPSSVRGAVRVATAEQRRPAEIPGWDGRAARRAMQVLTEAL